MKPTERTTESRGTYELPFLAGATFLGFLPPQLLGLADDCYLPTRDRIRKDGVFHDSRCDRERRWLGVWITVVYQREMIVRRAAITWIAAGRYPFTAESLSLNLLPVSRCNLSTTSPNSISINSLGKARELA
jgi:hypothetical protein